MYKDDYVRAFKSKGIKRNEASNNKQIQDWVKQMVVDIPRWNDKAKDAVERKMAI